jgi:opacity protein-like surface antigen
MTFPRAGIAVLCSLCLLTSAAHAGRVVPPRAGQVGIGLQGGYGALLQTGDYGNEFNGGGSYAVHLRYRMRYERALGLTFSAETFDARNPTNYDPADLNSIQPERLNTTLSGLDLYQMFGTRTPTTKYLLISGGLSQERVKLNDGETELSGQFSSDGLYLGAGAGIERFFWQSMAWDLSGRYNAIFTNGKPHHDVQLSLGVMWYASY